MKMIVLETQLSYFIKNVKFYFCESCAVVLCAALAPPLSTSSVAYVTSLMLAVF